MTSTITNTQSVPPGEFRIVPLSSLELREGFNPRTIRDSAKFAQTVQTVRECGILQPILVMPDGRPDAYYVVAGEGRYLAAGEAGQVEVPVIVCDVDERTHGLELAMIENLARDELDPVAEARGFTGLKAAGWTKKGIAEFFGISQKLVTERLQINELPEHLYPQIASGEIPLSAIKPLVTLAKIHPELPQTVAARVGVAPSNSWDEPLDWGAVVEDLIGALLSAYAGEEPDLPCDVYDASESYPVGRCTLSEKATKDLRALCALLGIEPEEFSVRFSRESVEQALALKAAYATKEGWNHLIVGQPVADQLAGDCIAAGLRNQRQLARAQREADKQRKEREAQREAEGLPASAGSGSRPWAPPMTEEQRKEQVREEKERQREIQRKAASFNLELGAAIVKHFGRVKVEERVMRVLTVLSTNSLSTLASRGARYGFPGWPELSETKAGTVKADYMMPSEALSKAQEFLAGASSTGEIAGRTLALLVMAHYADEKCVANSRRSGHDMYVPKTSGAPWASEVIRLLEEIAEERLPEHLTAHVRAERNRKAELVNTEKRAVKAAEELRGKLDDMTIEERLEALRAFGDEYGRHLVSTHWLRQDIQRRNAEDRGRAEQAAAEQPSSPAQSSESDEPREDDDNGASCAVDAEAQAPSEVETIESV